MEWILEYMGQVRTPTTPTCTPCPCPYVDLDT